MPQGHHSGSITIGDQQYPIEGIFTADGAAQVHIGGPFDYLNDPLYSMQFVGAVDANAYGGAIRGVVVGQACAAPTAGRFCGNKTAAEIALAIGEDVPLQIRVAVDDRQEIWRLSMSWADPSYWWGPPRVEYLGRLLQVTFAEFAQARDTIVGIDTDGRLFFQSPGSGCVGNGVIAARPDERHLVYDVKVTIENCGPTYAHLNREFEGLGTEFVWAPWDYHTSGFIMWLAPPEGEESPVALMVRGDWITALP